LKTIDIIVPAFNEAKNIMPFNEAIKSVFASLDYKYKIIFINDGSEDNTADELERLSEIDDNVKFINFSRNFGKDNALSAGLHASKGDAVVTIDADLQHPPSLIPTMINYWERDYEIIYAFRQTENEHASKLSKSSSRLFYNLINQLSDLKLEDGISDFRLLDKSVVKVLNNLKEQDLFYRGLIKWVGFNQKSIPYTPDKRAFGETKYSTKTLVRLALKGITSFTIKPLYIATYLGFTFSLLSLLYIPYIILSFIWEHPVSGWASVIATIAFFGGMQLMILGIIGMYLGKLFMQSKQRPHYIVKQSKL
jgi:dolichol-phosphate mannosyltransferase